MAITTGLVRRARLHMRTGLVAVLRSAVKAARLRASGARAPRQTRARLSMLGVPLAIVAAFTSGLWWATFPLVACAWWWAPRYTGWEWAGAVGRGLVGAEWALLGSSAIVTFPHDMLLVGTLWVLGAGLLMVCGPYILRELSPLARRRMREGRSVQMRPNSALVVRRRFAMHLVTHAPPSEINKRP